MVQEFQVLRCCGCETFQVHQVKKAKKWSCKLCAQKQSYIKVYGQGSGPDCRRHVQKLNMCRGETAYGGFQEVHCIPEESRPMQEQGSGQQPGKVRQEWSVGGESSSRWQQYLEAEAEGEAQVPEGIDSFTTDRQQFDRRTSAQRKERRQKCRDQRVSQQSGGWYHKPGPHDATSPYPGCTSTLPTARRPYSAGQHPPTPPYPGLGPQPDPSPRAGPHPGLGPQPDPSPRAGPHPGLGPQPDPSPRAGRGLSSHPYQDPGAVPPSAAGCGQRTAACRTQTPPEAQREPRVLCSGGNAQVNVPLRRNNVGGAKDKSVEALPAVSTSSKWSLFIDTSNNQGTDSESDIEDENDADDINNLGSKEHDRFRYSGSGTRKDTELATVTTMQGNAPMDAETPDLFVSGWSNAPLFSTEDDLDEILSI